MKRTLALLTGLAYGVLVAAPAAANPTGPSVAHGAATFAQPDAATLQITNTPNTVINWQGFSIGASETTQFIQHSAASAVLNRVVGVDPSQILGSLRSNGQVFLINPNGLVFGAGAVVDTAGFIGSTLGMRDADFLAGQLRFEGPDAGSIENHGVIKARGDGGVYLVAPQIENDGIVRTEDGRVLLAAGRKLTISSLDVDHISFEIQAPEDSVVNLGELLTGGGAAGVFAGHIVNAGRIRVDTMTRDAAGRIVLKSSGETLLASGSELVASAPAGQGGAIEVTGASVRIDDARVDASGVQGGTVRVTGTDGAVRNAGRIDVSGQDGGEVTLRAADNVEQWGTISADAGAGKGGHVQLQSGDTTVLAGHSRGGAIRRRRRNASGDTTVLAGPSSTSVRSDTGRGGRVELLGPQVGLFDRASVDASGGTGGGIVLVGGDVQGSGEVPTARAVYLGQDTAVRADATMRGDGGKVVVFGDEVARVYGALSARGGAEGGAGGFVETSGLDYFEIVRTPDVTAPHGTGGLWLIDPHNIEIIAGGGGANIDVTANPTFTANADTAQLGVDLLTTAMTGGASVLVDATKTVAASTQDGDITLSTNIDIDKGTGTNTLTLKAAKNITLNGEIREIGDTDGGTVDTLNLVLDGAGAVDINKTIALGGGSLTIQNTTSAVTVDGSVTTGGGNFSSTGTGSFANTVAINTSAGGDLTINHGSAAVTIGGALTVGGNLAVTAGGAVTQAGTVTVTGATSVDAGANAITLTDANNDFGGAVTLSNTGANAVSVVDKNALTLATLTLGGDLSATSIGVLDLGQGTVTGALVATSNGNAITQSGALTVTGTSDLNAGASTITLGNTSNDFGGAVTLSNTGANAVSVVDKNALTIGTLTLGGDLSATSTGALDLGQGTLSGNLTALSNGSAITQTGALTVTGTADVDAGTATIDLSNANNDFGGTATLSATGTSVSIQDKNALTLGAPTLGANTGFTAIAGTTLALAGGDLSTGTGNIDLQANGGTLTTAGKLTTTSGSIALTGSTGVSIGNDITTSAAGGTLSLSSTNSAINQTAGTITVADASTVNAGTGAVTLAQAGNDFKAAVGLTGGTTQVTDTNALTLGTLTLGGDLNATSTGALNVGQGTVTGNLVATSNNGAITQSGALTVTGTSTASAGTGTITLTDANNDFGAAVTLNATGASVSVQDKNALTLGTPTLGANTGILAIAGTALTLPAGDISTGTGNIDLRANGGALSAPGKLTTTTGNITLVGSAGLTLGDDITTSAAGGDLSLSSTNSAINQTAGTIKVAGATTVAAGTGAVTLGQAGNDFTGAVGLGGGTTLIVDATALTLGTLATSDLTATSTGALDLGQGTVGGNLVATSNNGAITQSGALTVTGTAGVDAGTATIDLSNANNDFGSTATLTATGASVSIQDKNALTLGAPTLGANTGFTAIAGTTLALAGGDLSTGTGNIDLQANGGTLTTVGKLTTTSGSIALTGSTGVSIGNDITTSAAGGTLSLSSTNSAINQTAGTITVADASMVNAGAGAVTLAQAGNDFQAAVGLTGGTTQVTDTNALTLGTLATGALTAASTGALDLGQGTVTGALVATSNGNAITQTGALTVTGTSDLNAGASTITLGNASNDFGGAVTLSNTGANAVSVVDKNALTLGALTVGGDLSATSSGALDLGQGTVGGNLTALSNGSAITQTGALTVTGTSDVNAGASTITLGNANNDFGGTVTLSNTGANAVSVVDKSALTLATLSVGGDLSATSTGALDLGQGTVGGNLTAASNGNAITQTGALTVTGTSDVNAGASTITLGNANNDFGGALTLSNTGANAVSVVDKNALTLGTLTLGGDLNATSTGALNVGQGTVTGNLVATSNNGAITQGGALTVTGTSTASAGTSTITLTDANNDFGAAVTLNATGASVSIQDKNALALGAPTLGANTGILAIAGTALTLPAGDISTGTGNIDLRANGGALSTPGKLTTTTGNITLVGSAGLTLGDDITTSAAGGDLSLSSTNSAINQTAGTIKVAGATTVAAGTGAVTLGQAGNDFTGAVGLGGGTTLIVDATALTLGTLATGDLTATSTGALDLGQGTVTGDLVATSNNGAVSQTAALTVTGTSNVNAGTAGIDLSNVINDFQGDVTLVSTGTSVAVRDKNALTLTSTGFGANTSITAIAGTALTLPAGDLSTGTGSINFQANGGTLTTAGKLTTTSGSISLTGSTGVSIGHDITTSAAGGDLSLSSTNSAINQTAGTIKVAGATTVAAGAAAITLSDANNDFTGTVSLSNTGANAAAVSDKNALTLGTLALGGDLTANASVGLELGQGTVGGNLAVTAGGAVTQTGALTVTGTSNLNAGTADIDLSNVNNDFQAGVNLVSTGTSVTVLDKNALTLTSTAFGANTSITAIAGTALTLPAGDLSTGTGSINFQANGGTLTTAGKLTTTSGSISLTGSTGVSIGHDITTSAAGGDLSLSSTNSAINQTAGTIKVAGATTVAAGAAAITLSDANNDFTGTVSLSNTGANAASVTDKNALTLGTLALGGDLNANASGALNLGQGAVAGNLTGTSNGGAVTQSGALAVTGATTVVAGTGNVTLDKANNFDTVAITSATNATVNDNNTLSLGTSTLTGTLTATAGTNLIQSGDQAVGGLSTLTAGNNVTLSKTLTTGGANITAGGVFTNNGTLNAQGGNATIASKTVALGGASNLEGTAGLTLRSPAGAAIGLGNTSGAYNLTQAALNTISDNFTNVSIGNAATPGAVSLSTVTLPEALVTVQGSGFTLADPITTVNINGTTGRLNFTSAIAGGGNNLTATDAVSLNGSVTNVGKLSLQAVNIAGATAITADNLSIAGAATGNARLILQRASLADVNIGQAGDTFFNNTTAAAFSGFNGDLIIGGDNDALNVTSVSTKNVNIFSNFVVGGDVTVFAGGDISFQNPTGRIAAKNVTLVALGEAAGSTGTIKDVPNVAANAVEATGKALIVAVGPIGVAGANPLNMGAPIIDIGGANQAQGNFIVTGTGTQSIGTVSTGSQSTAVTAVVNNLLANRFTLFPVTSGTVVTALANIANTTGNAQATNQVNPIDNVVDLERKLEDLEKDLEDDASEDDEDEPEGLLICL